MDKLDVKASTVRQGRAATVVTLAGVFVLVLAPMSQAFADVAKGGGPSQMAARADAIKKISCPPGRSIVKDSLKWIDARTLFDHKWFSADLQYACTSQGDGVTQMAVLATMLPPPLSSQPNR